MNVLEESRLKRLDVYNNEIFKWYYRDGWIKNQGLCDKFLADVKVQELAIQVIKDKWNQDSFRSLILVGELLLNSEKIDSTIYQTLKKDILSNSWLAHAKDGRLKTYFLTLLLENEDLVLNSEQKEFVFKQLEDETYSKSIYDNRYYLLRNKSLSKDEKKYILDNFYCDLEEYRDFIDTIAWDVVNSSLDEHGLPQVEIADIYIDSGRIFDKLDEENDKNYLELLKEVSFIRLLLSMRNPYKNAPLVKTKK